MAFDIMAIQDRRKSSAYLRNAGVIASFEASNVSYTPTDLKALQTPKTSYEMWHDMREYESNLFAFISDNVNVSCRVAWVKDEAGRKHVAGLIFIGARAFDVWALTPQGLVKVVRVDTEGRKVSYNEALAHKVARMCGHKGRAYFQTLTEALKDVRARNSSRRKHEGLSHVRPHDRRAQVPYLKYCG